MATDGVAPTDAKDNPFTGVASAAWGAPPEPEAGRCGRCSNCTLYAANVAEVERINRTGGGFAQAEVIGSWPCLKSPDTGELTAAERVSLDR